MNKWVLYPLIILVVVILMDELIYKNWRVAFRGEHWSQALGENNPLPNTPWTNRGS